MDQKNQGGGGQSGQSGGSGGQQFGSSLDINTWDDVKSAVQKAEAPQRGATFCQVVPKLLHKFRTEPGRLDEIIQHIHMEGPQLLGYAAGSTGGSR